MKYAAVLKILKICDKSNIEMIAKYFKGLGHVTVNRPNIYRVFRTNCNPTMTQNL